LSRVATVRDAHRIFNAEDAEGKQKAGKKKTRNGFLLRLLNPFGLPSALNPRQADPPREPRPRKKRPKPLSLEALDSRLRGNDG
jgi:hypothetical protein